MPSCFLKRHIWLAKVFHKSSSPPSKGFLDLTPHKFQSTTQKSEQKNFKLFLLWLLLLLSHIHLLQLLSCSNLLQEPWPNHKDCFSFLGYVITFLQFFLTSRCFVCFTRPCIDLLGSRSGGGFQGLSHGNLLLYCQSPPEWQVTLRDNNKWRVGDPTQN